MNSERREQYRMSWDNRICQISLNDGLRLECSVVNVSHNGVLFRAEHQLREGESIQLALTMYEDDDEPIHLFGEVVRIEHEPSEEKYPWLYGCWVTTGVIDDE